MELGEGGGFGEQGAEHAAGPRVESALDQDSQVGGDVLARGGAVGFRERLADRVEDVEVQVVFGLPPPVVPLGNRIWLVSCSSRDRLGHRGQVHH